jgi:glycosyltransferase involved in cell wall biosynthesis
MIKVAYDNQVFSWQEYGGISRYFYELARRVSAIEGFKAAVLAPIYINRYLKNGGARVWGVRVPIVRKTDRMVGLANRLITPSLFTLFKPNVVHETYYRAMKPAYAGAPTVVTVYDMIHEKYKSQFHDGDQTTVAKRAAVARADRVICISESTRSDLISLFGTAPEKIKMIHLGFSFSARSERVHTLALPKPFFLYVGQRTGYKNFIKLLSAYAGSRSLRTDFDLICFGGGPFSAEERRVMSTAGLDSGNVRQLHGDDSLLCDLYRRATAFVYPSLYEGFGIPPLEAMSMGCPVLCSRTSSIPEVVGDAGLYFNPDSVDEMQHAMEQAASSDGLRSQLITLGVQRVKEFSYDRCAAATVTVYRDALQ